ncbi:MAG: hypothetical protein WAQ27_03810 [Candidatus Microsaccharimonas sp.]
MSKATRQILPEDISELATEPLVFSLLDKWKQAYDYEDTYEEADALTEPISLMTIKDITRHYDVTEPVAKSIQILRSTTSKNIDAQVQSMFDSSDRYLQVKPYLGNDEYDRELLYDYAVQINRSSKLTKTLFDPIVNLRHIIIAGLSSLFLLAGFVAATSSYLDGQSLMGNIPAVVFAVVWLFITIYFLLKAPKKYRTRKLIMKLNKNT